MTPPNQRVYSVNRPILYFPNAILEISFIFWDENGGVHFDIFPVDIRMRFSELLANTLCKCKRAHDQAVQKVKHRNEVDGVVRVEGLDEHQAHLQNSFHHGYIFPGSESFLWSIDALRIDAKMSLKRINKKLKFVDWDRNVVVVKPSVVNPEFKNIGFRDIEYERNDYSLAEGYRDPELMVLTVQIDIVFPLVEDL